MKISLNKVDPYQSHAPVLVEALRRVKGPVLEMGSGNGSTVLLHSVCRDLVVTLDHDQEWIDRYSAMFSDAHQHIFKCMDFAEMLEFCSKTVVPWAVVFIDQGDWQNRWDCLLALHGKSQIIILHDSDIYADKLDGLFNYARTVMPAEPWPAVTGPPTFIGSDSIDVTQWKIDMNVEEMTV